MLLFAGDPHGAFRHLEEAVRGHGPDALILLGDNEPPLPETLPALDCRTSVHFILGNHDTDREASLTHHDPLVHRDLNGRVTEVKGTRVAGLSGVFREKVWHPEAGLTWSQRADLAAATPAGDRFRDGPPLRHWSSIWWEDYAALWEQRADVLVTHEAPESHPYGHEALGDLARALEVHTVVHGHQHENYMATIPGNDAEPIRVIGVAKQGLADLAGNRLITGTERQRAELWTEAG
ncbi:metallophosphoesterase family protein [Thiohalorhabdus sp. Cl-TMA]|uniref:Metallophosphoesterase n=1 Tax=Thiohalorhabdus methylotrophus TaxID=3242694 RepID=A0ABV4TQF4_9GAMM